MAQFPLRDGESEPYTPRVSGANPKNFAAITRAARDGIPGAVRPMPPQANGVMNCPQPSPRAHMRCVEQRPAWAPAFLPDNTDAADIFTDIGPLASEERTGEDDIGAKPWHRRARKRLMAFTKSANMLSSSNGACLAPRWVSESI